MTADVMMTPTSQSRRARARLASLTLASLTLALGAGGCGGEDDAHAGHGAGATEVQPLPSISAAARVYFPTIADGATVVGDAVDGKVRIHVQMGADELTVMPAGTLQDGAGHHHLIIDEDPIPEGTAVPADEHHIHYGAGQTAADVELAPGPHVLRLQFADGAHRSYGEQLRASVNINVAARDLDSPPVPDEAPPAAEGEDPAGDVAEGDSDEGEGEE